MRLLVLRERVIRTRNSSLPYNHAVDTFASEATVRKLISRPEASMRCSAARARSIACSLRNRALRLRPAIFHICITSCLPVIRPQSARAIKIQPQIRRRELVERIPAFVIFNIQVKYLLDL